jgi:hypothetical protein
VRIPDTALAGAGLRRPDDGGCGPREGGISCPFTPVRRLVLSVLALLVLLPSAAFARPAYLCRFDGQLRSSCCCPAGSAPGSGPAQARPHRAPGPTSARDACCCTVLEQAPSPAQPAAEAGAAGWPTDPPVAVVSAVAPAVRSRIPAAVLRPRSTAPPGRGQDLLARQCVFLL